MKPLRSSTTKLKFNLRFKRITIKALFFTLKKKEAVKERNNSWSLGYTFSVPPPLHFSIWLSLSLFLSSLSLSPFHSPLFARLWILSPKHMHTLFFLLVYLSLSSPSFWGLYLFLLVFLWTVLFFYSRKLIISIHNYNSFTYDNVLNSNCGWNN